MTVYNFKQVLSYRDEIGLDFECQFYNNLRTSNLAQYITYMNPIHDPIAWKKETGHGCDFRLYINGVEIEIETKYMMTDYHYRIDWFNRDIAPRFKNPNSIKITCSNRPQNLADSEAVQLGANLSYNYQYLSLYDTISYLLSLLSVSITNTIIIDDITNSIVDNTITDSIDTNYKIDKIDTNYSYVLPIHSILVDNLANNVKECSKDTHICGFILHKT